MSKTLDQRAFISIEEGLGENQKKNLNIVVGLLSFSAMLFHFAAVYFFTFKLGSLVLVGIFLGLGNFFAFLFDVPIGILQYYFRAKTLLLFGAISQVIAMVIFANFIFGATDFLATEIAQGLDGVELLAAVLRFFLDDVLNLILLFFASICYGFTREVNDITLLSYVLNNASPAEYKSIIAQNNLFSGVGGLFGLVLSGVILAFTPKLIVFCILVIFIAIIFISLKFFDSKDKVINLQNIKKYSVYFDHGGLEKIKNSVGDAFTEKTAKVKESVSSIDLKKVLGSSKYIFMKPVVLNTQMITLPELFEKTKQSFIDIGKTLLFSKNSSLIVYWSFCIVLTFGFWDTFASTFLLAFLDEVKSGWSYVLLGVIAVPAFALQEFFGKVADKRGSYFIANVGLAISGISLVVMSFFAANISFPIVMVLALANSVGYAICMSLSVAVFLESYNKSYAEKNKLKEVDSNASAAPMKILQNLANVVGLVFGGFILKVAGYSGFFAIFGTMILIFLGWSLWKRKELQGR